MNISISLLLFQHLSLVRTFHIFCKTSSASLSEFSDPFKKVEYRLHTYLFYTPDIINYNSNDIIVISYHFS